MSLRGSVSAKLAADLAGRALLFALFVVAARLLGVPTFGAYAFALAVGLICGQLADGGLQFTLLKRLAGHASDQERAVWLHRSVRARTISAVLVGAAGAALAALPGATPGEALALATLCVSQVVMSQAELWLQVVRAAERLELEALVGLGGRATVATAGIAILVAGGGLTGLAVAHLGGSAVTLLVSARLARRFVAPSAGDDGGGLRQTWLEALPLTVATVASLLMFRIDVILLEVLRGVADVGRYAAAYRPLEVALIVPVAVMAGVFPRLVRLAAARSHLGAFGLKVGGVLLATACVGALVGWLIGPAVLAIAYGAGYEAAGDVLRVLVTALPFIYVNALLSQVLIALGRAWRVALAMLVALVANVAFNLVLIPSLGPHGAALATVAAEAALTVACALFLLRPSGHADGAATAPEG